MKEGYKKCCKCKKEKPLSDFHKNKRSKDGRNYRCKQCHHEVNSTEKQKEFHRKRAREWYDRNRDKHKIQCRRSGLKRYYGMTQEDYDRMFKEQEGKCKICGDTNPVKGKYFCVDHNHETGKIRGLLCDNCNKAIGHLKENIETAEKLIQYLKNQ